MAFCGSCGASVAEGVGFCGSCGKPVGAAGQAPPASAAAGPVAAGTASATQSTTGGLEDNVAGMLAYITIIPAIIFLVIEPFNKRPFVRFHSFQSIFFNVAWIILWVALNIVGQIPVLGWATFLIWPLIGLGGLVIWVILLLKAYQRQMFHLPVIGALAEKQAGTA